MSLQVYYNRVIGEFDTKKKLSIVSLKILVILKLLFDENLLHLMCKLLTFRSLIGYNVCNAS